MDTDASTRHARARRTCAEARERVARRLGTRPWLAAPHPPRRARRDRHARALPSCPRRPSPHHRATSLARSKRKRTGFSSRRHGANIARGVRPQTSRSHWLSRAGAKRDDRRARCVGARAAACRRVAASKICDARTSRGSSPLDRVDGSSLCASPTSRFFAHDSTHDGSQGERRVIFHEPSGWRS